MTKISIVTATYNAEKFIEKNIQNIISQNVNNVEHILVDGMSNDKTLDIVDKHRSHFSKIIIGKDYGIYDAMNKGILAAKGDLIGILNADDCYNKNTLSLVLKTYESSKKKDVIIYGDMYQDYDGIKSFSYGDLSNFAFQNDKIRINHPTVFVSKSIYNKIGLFDIKYTRGADKEFLMRAYNHKFSFIKINKILAFFKLGGFTSSYDLKSVIDRTIEEYQLYRKYYPTRYVIKNTLIQFLRLSKNLILINILGQRNFLKKQIKKLKIRNDI
jgi:glycosyltransferase involved in cell wall biosynthesis